MVYNDTAAAKSTFNAVAACICAEVIFLSSGMLWLASVAHLSFSKALLLGVLPYVPGEIIKIYATGLGLVTPDAAKEGLATGTAYSGPALNDPVSSVSS